MRQFTVIYDSCVLYPSRLRSLLSGQLRTYDIEAIHPDTFLVCQFDLSSAAVCAAVRTHRTSLKRPPRDAEDYLNELEQDGLHQIVELLRQSSDRI